MLTVRPCSYAYLIACATLLFTQAAVAELFVYELPGGARMITDHRLENKQYKLVRSSTKVKGLGNFINHKNPQAVLADINAYDEMIRHVARTHTVDAALIKAVMHAESGFNPNAVSHKGASGLMQLMPATAELYGVQDIFDPKQNIRAGAQYLGYLLKKFNNNHRLALAAYNAGEGAVLRYKGIPPYAETRGYVQKVLAFKGRYLGLMKPVAPKSQPSKVVATLDVADS